MKIEHHHCPLPLSHSNAIAQQQQQQQHQRHHSKASDGDDSECVNLTHFEPKTIKPKSETAHTHITQTHQRQKWKKQWQKQTYWRAAPLYQCVIINVRRLRSRQKCQKLSALKESHSIIAVVITIVAVVFTNTIATARSPSAIITIIISNRKQFAHSHTQTACEWVSVCV